MKDVNTQATPATWWYRRAQGQGWLPITAAAAALLAAHPDECRNEGVEICLAEAEHLGQDLHPACRSIVAAKPHQQPVADFLTHCCRRPIDVDGTSVPAELERWRDSDEPAAAYGRGYRHGTEDTIGAALA